MFIARFTARSLTSGQDTRDRLFIQCLDCPSAPRDAGPWRMGRGPFSLRRLVRDVKINECIMVRSHVIGRKPIVDFDGGYDALAYRRSFALPFTDSHRERSKRFSIRPEFARRASFSRLKYVQSSGRGIQVRDGRETCDLSVSGPGVRSG